MLIKYNSFLLCKFRRNKDICFRINFCKDCKNSIFIIDYFILKGIEIHFFIGNLKIYIIIYSEDYNSSSIYVQSINAQGLSIFLSNKEYKKFNKKVTKLYNANQI